MTIMLQAADILKVQMQKPDGARTFDSASSVSAGRLPRSFKHSWRASLLVLDTL